LGEIKLNYDEDADVLYVSFGRSEHVTGIELADNILLRLDTGRATQTAPRAVGLTFISFSRLMAHHRDKPLTLSLERLRNLPENLWPIVMQVITSPPVSDFLTAELIVEPRVPPLPQVVQP
jgi:hypothetical protein